MPYSYSYSRSTTAVVRTAVLVRLYSTVVLYCTFAFSVQQKFSLLSWQGFGQQDQIRSGQQHQIRSNSEILLAQISVCLRFLAGAQVFEAAEIQIRQQILNPCLLLASGLRDYE